MNGEFLMARLEFCQKKMLKSFLLRNMWRSYRMQCMFRKRFVCATCFLP